MNQKTTIRGLTLQRASLAWITRPWSRAVIDAWQGGRLVHADLAHRSVNRRIVIFWFARQAGSGGSALTGLAAYEHGRPPSSGQATPGAGQG